MSFVVRTWCYERLSWLFSFSDSIPEKILKVNIPIPNSEDDLHTTCFEVKDLEVVDLPQILYEKKLGAFLCSPAIHDLSVPKIGEMKITVSKNRKGILSYKAAKIEDGKEYSFGQFPTFADMQIEIQRESASLNFYDLEGDCVARIYPLIGYITTPEIMRKYRLLGDRSVTLRTRPVGELPEVVPTPPPHIKPTWAKKKDADYYRTEFAEKMRGKVRMRSTTHHILKSTKKQALRHIAYNLNMCVESPSDKSLKTFTTMDEILRSTLLDHYKVNIHTKGGKGGGYKRFLDLPETVKSTIINKVAQDCYKPIWAVVVSAAASAKGRSIFGYGGSNGKLTNNELTEITQQLIQAGNDDNIFLSPKEMEGMKESDKANLIQLKPTSPVYQGLEKIINNYGLDGKSLIQKILGKKVMLGNGRSVFFGDLRTFLMQYLNDRLPEFAGHRVSVKGEQSSDPRPGIGDMDDAMRYYGSEDFASADEVEDEFINSVDNPTSLIDTYFDSYTEEQDEEEEDYSDDE